ncbi:MAG: histidinol-phosphate transaminase [Flavobacteriaceae bacterium]|nr:histidinol-phosphate transaminase [Flavobacteriaceae bacterium]MDG1965475.1 histidinol-phosphate transaminase [Flavobacteriaceae bacterium]
MSKIDITQLVRPMVREITPYRSARDDFEDFEAQKVFLDANENPYKSIANRYPDPLQCQLKRTLAKIKGVEANQILLGNGSDEVLDLVFRAFCEPGQDEVILLPPTYGMYTVLAQLNNVKVNTVPLNESFQLDLEGIMKQVNGNTKVIFVCSPNNPTGNSIPLEQIQNLLNQFSGLVVVDEAYVDFSTKGSAVRFLDDYPHLMICQTFSKAYGLAGIRLGMGIADSKIIDYFNKIKPPYNVNVLTQKMAFNSLNDQHTTKEHVKELLAERQKLEKELLNIDFVNKIYPSDANFLLIQVDNASKRYDQLLSLDIVVRNRSSLLGCENTLRITVGTPQENIRLINACKTIK